MNKKCPRCKITKKAGEFYSGSAKDGLSPYCKECSREYKRARDKKRRENIEEIQRAAPDFQECIECGTQKPIDEFHSSPTNATGYATKCKPCAHAYQSQYWHDNKEEQYKKDYARKKNKIRANQRKLWNYLSNKCCTDCGTVDIRVLEFDHVRGKKKQTVSYLCNSGRSWEKVVLPEIAKCEIVCSNCHKIRTGEARGWFRELRYNGG